MPDLTGQPCTTQSHSPAFSRSSRTPSASSVHPPPPHLDTISRQVHWGQDEVYSQAQTIGEDGKDGRGEVSEQEGEDEDEGEQESVLAISAMKNRLGCCYYDATTHKLHFIEDQSDSSSWDLTNLILEQLLPSTVLTSSTADLDFLSSLESTLSTLPVSGPSSHSNTSGASSAADDQPVKLEYRPAREFYAGSGKLALSQVNIIEGGGYAQAEDEAEVFAAAGGAEYGEAEDEDEQGRDAYEFGRKRKRRRTGGGLVEGDRTRRNRELRLEAFFTSLSASPLSLGCAGTLLSFLSRSRMSAGELEQDGFDLTGLELLRLDKIMHINSDALTSLQIFSDESHASMHSSATKEGLSLFGIVNVARTPLGRLLMKQWFLRPSLSLEVINSRQTAVECFLRSENQHVVDAMQANFRLIKNTPRVVKTLASGRGGLKDWQTIWQVLYGAIMIRDAALNLVHRKEVEVVERLLTSFDALKWKEVGGMITDIIDWEESSLQKGRVCVRPGVDADLDQWRRQLNGLPSFLSKVAQTISTSLPPSLGVEELSLVYFPQLGYLITIPYEPEVVDAGKYGAVGWDFQFVTEARAYFKSDKCYDLDKHMGDLHSFMADKEIEIIHALLQHLLRLSPSLLAVSDILSELDCLVAFAEASRLYEWERPRVVEEGVCEIVGGRHPLAELCVESFVRNSTSLLASSSSIIKPELDDSSLDGKDDKWAPASTQPKPILILTGANFSGKSVYLKQIALIVFLAHIGCYVPAESATIGLTDRVLTRVSTRESITRGSSAFLIDLQQMSFILRNATSRSLVLLDEFGKGTEANDGAGLFCGVVEWLSGLGREAPRTIVTAHFQHVFLNGQLSRSLPGVELAHMEVLVQDDSTTSASSRSKKIGEGGEATEKLTYLYRLHPGLSLSSHAASCALLFGLPPSVVARANHITHLVSLFDLDALALEEGEETEEERRERREGERVGRGVLEWELGEDGEGEEDGEDGEEGLGEMRERLRRLLEGVEEDE